MPLNMVTGPGTMDDTTSSHNDYQSMLFQHWVTTSFDPEKTDELPITPVKSQMRFFAGTDAEFISEYRHQLSVLNMRLQSDYGELKARYHWQSKRLDTLEGLVPQLRMQQHQLAEVCRDVRAMKRTVTELQCEVETRKSTVSGRIDAIFDRFMQAIKGDL